MRKWWLLLIALLLLGGGYFGFKFYNNSSSPANTEPKTVKAEDKDKRVIAEDKKSKYEDIENKEYDIPTDKVWEFSFGNELDSSTVNTQNITITDGSGDSVPVGISLANEQKTIRITPPSGGYKKGETYVLHVENKVGYTNGGTVSKPYDLAFSTQRDKVEKGEMSKKLVSIKEKQIQSQDGNVLGLDKSVKKDLKIGEILIVTDKKPNGQALKITSVTSNKDSYQVTVTEPSFSELFDNLDIYNTYDIDMDNIKLEKGIEAAPIAQSTPNTMISSTSNKGKDLEDYEFRTLPTISSSYSKSKGLEFTISKMQLKKGAVPVYSDATIKMLAPQITVDTKVTGGKKNRIVLTERNETQLDLGIYTGVDEKVDFKRGVGAFGQLNKEKKEIKSIEDAMAPRVQTKIARIKGREDVKLASATIPIPEFPIVQIKIAIYMHFVFEANGKVGAYASAEIIDETGVESYKGEDKPHKKVTRKKEETEYSIQGKGSGEFRAGVLGEAAIQSYDIAAAGIEGFAGVKFKGEGTQGVKKPQGLFTCFDTTGSVIANGNVYVEVKDLKNEMHRFINISIGEAEFFKKQNNTCDVFEELKPLKLNLELDSGEKTDLMPVGKYIDLKTITNHYERLKNTSNFNISYTKSGVVKVEKVKGDRLVVKALGNPKAGDTVIILKYTETNKAFEGKHKKKTDELRIPVKIPNYGQYDSLKGEWSLVDDYGGSDLNILDMKNNQLKFEINASSGGHANGFEGTTAKIKNNEAVYVDEDTNCRINFVLDKKDTITVYESSECNLNNVSIEGDYKKGKLPVPEQKSLSELTNGEISEERDEAIRNLVGEDYGIFVTNTQQYVVDGEEDVDGFGSTVITTAVQGLYKYNEAIYMLSTSGDLFLATIVDGEKVRFYTDNELYQDELPLTIQNWMSRFSDYPVEYRYKPITDQ